MDKKWGGANFTKSESLLKSKSVTKSESFTNSKSVTESESFSISKSGTKFKNIIGSNNVTNIVDAKTIIDKITLVNKRCEDSNNRTKNLLSHIDRARNSIDAVFRGDEGRSWGSLDKEALLDLIKKVNDASSKSVSSISQLIESNNENSKLLAEMISALTMLSGLSFEKISETTKELDEIVSQINENSKGSQVQGNQITRIVISQIEKIKEERKRADIIEYNFKEINENLREIIEDSKLIENALTRTLEIHNYKIEEIENGIMKTFRNQKNRINMFSIISLTNLVLLVGFIIYFIWNQ